MKHLKLRGVIYVVFCFVFLGIFLKTALSLPSYHETDTPVFSHVASRYMTMSEEETHSPNMVTAVLADYRGFDTLGETSVIFTAGAVTFVLVLMGRKKKSRWEMEP